MKTTVVLAALVMSFLVFQWNFTIFVIQPIGAVPEGRTLIVSRQGALLFVDSADAICERVQGGVSLLCRIAAMGTVAKETTIYIRLPYSEALYLYSTGGKTYSR